MTGQRDGKRDLRDVAGPSYIYPRWTWGNWLFLLAGLAIGVGLPLLLGRS